MNIRKVLFPTDFSDAADSALPHALEISKRFDARITLLHVRTLFTDDPSDPEYQEFTTREFEERLEMILDGAEGSSSHHTDSVDTVVLRSVSAAPAILDYASESEMDLIVMGTHGRSGLSHFLLGSVAEKVVRHAACPVMTVAHRRKNYRNNTQYQKILAPYDFSEYSKVAVRNGLAFSKTFAANLDVLYVVEQTVHPYYDDIWKVSIEEELPKISQAAQKSLASALKKGEMKDLHFEIKVGDADGKAENEIVEYAKAGEFDLIVMGTHGLSGLDHALLGSTTERVIRTASCPVLTFHGKSME